jgi:hypothetical protein
MQIKLRFYKSRQNLRYALNWTLFLWIAYVSFLAMIINSTMIEIDEDKFWISHGV